MAVRVGATTYSLPAVDRRFVIGGLLAAVAAILVLVLTSPPARTPILVAGSDLPAGTALSGLDVIVRHVTEPDGLVEGTSLGELESWVLTVPLREGEPLIASVLEPPIVLEAPHVVSLSLPKEHAVLGLLGPGDVVDVYATSNDVGQQPTTTVVARDVHVIAVSEPDGPTGQGDLHILVAVDDELAARLTAASRSAGLDLVKVRR